MSAPDSQDDTAFTISKEFDERGSRWMLNAFYLS